MRYRDCPLTFNVYAERMTYSNNYVRYLLRVRSWAVLVVVIKPRICSILKRRDKLKILLQYCARLMQVKAFVQNLTNSKADYFIVCILGLTDRLTELCSGSSCLRQAGS